MVINAEFFTFHKGALLFDGNAKEAFDKAKEANGGELKVKDSSVTWQLLEGDEEKEALKRIIEAQQETQKNKGRGKITFQEVGSAFQLYRLYTPQLINSLINLIKMLSPFKCLMNGMGQYHSSFLKSYMPGSKSILR